MSIEKGNILFNRGDYFGAINEYKKIKNTEELYESAIFNISLSERRLGKIVKSDALPFQTLQKAKIEESAIFPRLSIIMPVFNVAPYLDTSIVSALSQKYQNFELIIINDASTDNGKKIIEMHQGQDPRIKLIDLPNNTLGGAGIPSNFGIGAATGEYIAFIDSDDWVKFDAFSILMEKALHYNADIVIGNFCTFLDDSRVVSQAYDRAIWDKLPKDKIISIKDNPELFHLSPVPWRKIYKRKFLIENNIRYPEGDYFYEDNPLHWFVLSKAEKVVVTDCLVSYHRMAREGQTMAASSYKLSAVCAHLNTIFNFIEKIQGDLREVVFAQFYDYWYRTDWIVNRQSDKSFEQKIIKKRLANIYHSVNAVSSLKTSRKNFLERVVDYTNAYPDIDLTIVISTYESSEFLKECLDSLFKISGLRFNVLIIDNELNNGVSKILIEYQKKSSNFHVVRQRFRGHGRARNSVIPMCTGKYTLFLGEQSVINSDELVKAYKTANEKKSDILILKRQKELFDGKVLLRKCIDDEELWEKIADANKSIAFKMNYAVDNKLIKTTLLQNSNIFFGAGSFFNELGFHWHSLISAKKVDFFPYVVCGIRQPVIRNTIPSGDGKMYIELFDELFALRKILESRSEYKNLFNVFKDVASGLMKSVEDYVPIDKQNDMNNKKREFLK